MQRGRETGAPPAIRRGQTLGVLALSVALGLLVPAGVAGSSDAGSLAYITRGRDIIRVVSPDGAGDRLIWRVPDGSAGGVEDVAWSPDGTRLAFSSGHQATCSVWHADLYVVDGQGGQAERVTNPPGCEALAGLPTGSVSFELRNYLSDESIFVVYVQGAPDAQVVTLAAGYSTQVTFDQVADLGEGVPQFVSVAVGSMRWLSPGTYADVVAGTNVSAGWLDLGETAYDTWGALTASWSPDASRLAFQLGLGLLWQIELGGPALDEGMALLGEGASPGPATHPVWSPAADEVLYLRYDTFPFTVERAAVNATGPGEPVAYANNLNGIDWLPDGSGWVASDDGEILDDNANLFMGRFGEDSITQLTFLPAGQRAWWPTVSPDGTQVAYTLIHGPAEAPESVELRILDLDDGSDRLVIPDALQADWGP